MNYSEFSELLKSGLELSHPPIALSFLMEPPPGVPPYTGSVPSACTFWRRAEEGLFYTTAEDHFSCPIGTMTMGFDLPPDGKKEAENLMAEMLKLQYLSEAEFPEIPSVKKPHRIVVYGPLADFKIIPDAVLMIVNPSQAMILSEAGGSSSWNGPSLSFLGRPTCGAIPKAMENQVPVTSSACIGARVYAELQMEELVAVVPGTQLEILSNRFQNVLTANRVLSDYHTAKKNGYSKPK